VGFTHPSVHTDLAHMPQVNYTVHQLVGIKSRRPSVPAPRTYMYLQLINTYRLASKSARGFIHHTCKSPHSSPLPSPPLPSTYPNSIRRIPERYT